MNHRDRKKLAMFVGGAVGVGAIGALVAYFWSGSSGSAPSLPPPGETELERITREQQEELARQEAERKKAEKERAALEADARNADLAFVASTATASATAVLAVTGSAPYVGASTPIVVGAWKGLSIKDKANVWRGKPTGGSGAATGAAANADASSFPSNDSARAQADQPVPKGDQGVAGWNPWMHAIFKGAPTGPAGVLKWAVDMFIKVLKQKIAELRGIFCTNADKVYQALKEKGAAVPKQSKWDKFSCDQKIGFVFALGGFGLQMLVAGALLGGWAADAKGMMKQFGSAAANAVNQIAAQIGGGAETLSTNASNWASDAASSVGIKF